MMKLLTHRICSLTILSNIRASSRLFGWNLIKPHCPVAASVKSGLKIIAVEWNQLLKIVFGIFPQIIIPEMLL